MDSDRKALAVDLDVDGGSALSTHRVDFVDEGFGSDDFEPALVAPELCEGLVARVPSENRSLGK